MKHWAKSLLAVLAFLCLLVPVQGAEIPNTSVFSQTDGSNNSGTVPTWAEGQAPSQVNDSARALQGAITRNWNWEHPTLTSGGSANAQTLTYSVAPAAYYNGQRFCYEAGFATTSSSTLNVNSLGAVAVKYLVAGTLTDTGANTIRAGDRPCVTYRSTGPSMVLETGGSTTIPSAGTSTDNAITRWDGTGGSALQNSTGWIIDDSGRMVRGNASALATFDNTSDTPSLQVLGIDTNTSMAALARFSASSNGPAFYCAKSRNAAVGSYTVAQADDTLCLMQFEGDDGDEFQQAAEIRALLDGTPGDGDMPGRLQFGTSPDGSNSALQRMRIDSGHNIFAYKDDGANPGQVVAEHWLKLNADYTLADSTSAQKLFNATTNGRLTLDTGEYMFEALIHVSAMSATSGNAAFDLVGAGTLTAANIFYHACGIDSTTPLAAGATSCTGSITSAGAASMVSAFTGTGMLARLTGTFEVTAAGTLIPSIDLVTGGVTPVVEQGSYFRTWRIGNTGTDTIGAWD